ncbi:MAG: hemin uptake protein HemP [Pirellulales bacterium]|nr:hemin uptake protein HemP [Pirellulales bacterium]
MAIRLSPRPMNIRSDSLPANPADDAAANSPRVLNSQDLLQGHREVLIEHAGERYRLLLTRNGKLLLQK